MREAPFVEQFAQQNSGQANVVSIGFGTDLATSRAFASDYGLTTPLGLTDVDTGVGLHYKVYNFPSWLLIDSSGNLVDQGTRFDSSVQSALDALG